MLQKMECGKGAHIDYPCMLFIYYPVSLFRKNGIVYIFTWPLPQQASSPPQKVEEERESGGGEEFPSSNLPSLLARVFLTKEGIFSP